MSSPQSSAARPLLGTPVPSSSNLSRQLFSAIGYHPAFGPPQLPTLTFVSSSKEEIDRAVGALRELYLTPATSLTVLQRCWVHLEHIPSDTSDDGLEKFVFDCNRFFFISRLFRLR